MDPRQELVEAVEAKLRAEWPYIDIEQGHNGYYDDDWRELATHAVDACLDFLAERPSLRDTLGGRQNLFTDRPNPNPPPPT